MTSTLGRGGSDYTASIVGGHWRGGDQIWTDVDGMLTSDPTIPPGYRVKQCSFAKRRVSVLRRESVHPATVLPAIEKNIPVRIRIRGGRRWRNADHGGGSAVGSPIHSIACKRNITLVNIVSTRMLMAHGFLKRIFEIFDHMEHRWTRWRPRGQRVADHRNTVLSGDYGEIEEFADVTVDDSQAAIVWGDNIRHAPEWPRFAALKECAHDFAGRVAAEHQPGGGGGGS